MADLLGPEPSLSAAELKLAKADLHGALLTVERGRCPQLVGVSGIVVQETTNTFVVVTRAGRVRRLPKQHHVFVLQLGDALSVRVFGNHLRFRTTERSARKLKAKTTVEL
jgi:ribonuclease P protein subunit POP4